MPVDLVTVFVGLASFTIFLLVQVVSFRWVKHEHVLAVLSALMIFGLGLPLILMAVFFVSGWVHASWQAGILMAGMSLLIHGLLCFFYVLSVFGAYEASVRVRLLREIAKADPGGLSIEEILRRYNPEVITRLRLCRLVGSGDVVECDGMYSASFSKSLFLLFGIIMKPFSHREGAGAVLTTKGRR